MRAFKLEKELPRGTNRGRCGVNAAYASAHPPTARRAYPGWRVFGLMLIVWLTIPRAIACDTPVADQQHYSRQSIVGAIRESGGIVRSFKEDGKVRYRVIITPFASVPNPNEAWKGSAADLAALSDLRPIESLHLHCALTDPNELDFLKEFDSLKSFSLVSPTWQADAAAKHLTGHVALSDVTIFAEMSDEGASSLAAISELRRLTLVGSSITDKGAMALAKLRKLRSLRLINAGLTDEGARHLCKLPDLKSVSFFGCPLTDRGVDSLAKLSKAERLDLRGTQLTSRGIATLSAKLPTCDIVFAYPSTE